MKERVPGRIRWFRIIMVLLPVLFIIAGLAGYSVYRKIYQPNVFLFLKNTDYLYIKTNADFRAVKDSLYARNRIRDKASFEWLAEKKNYTHQIRPGRYLLKNRMSNNDLINLLRSGKQEPVHLSFISLRTEEALAGVVAKQIEADSTSIMDAFGDRSFIRSLGFEPQTILSLCIPNTYQIYWNTDARKFLQRMRKEYDRFWTPTRKQLASAAGLTPVEVSVLASIIEQETNKDDEKPRMAGVYINRLKNNMLLQADPTLKFAAGDMTIRRILNRDKAIDSPYNTYKYSGLPPGPICIPSIASIDAVLNHEDNDYLYFCAKDDLSGYHNFAETEQQHMQYARLYQRALNKMRILR